jgi:RHS repeat-associated protein
VAVYCLIAFATLTLGALFVPLRLLRPRRPDVGREARRRRTWIQTIALALIPLMAIGPEAALAINNEALLYQAVAAAAAGQTGQYETTYTYDANGNMVSRTVTNGGSPFTDTYIYDAQNRLVAAELTVDETAYVSYGYDADGIRNRVTKNGVTTWHLTDPNRDYAQVLAEHNGSGEVYVRYCYGDDLISQTRDPSGSSPATRFYHYDGQLSTRQLTEGTPAHAELGVVKDTYTFDAFGNLLAKTGLTVNEYLYTGEQYDPNVGFYYLRARYYAQDVGRFTSRDPVAGIIFDPCSLHKYVYAGNDPVNKVDPSGQMTICGLTINISLRTVIICAVVAAALLLWPRIKRQLAPLWYYMLGTPMPRRDVELALEEGRKYWSGNPRVQEMIRTVDDGMCAVYMTAENPGSEGLTAVGSRFVVVSEGPLKRRTYLDLFVVMFAEWQHTCWGGSMVDDDETQKEFDEFRDQLPDHLRTEYINSLGHGRKQ